MGPLKQPPPVRRIVVDDEPTVVEPPKGNGTSEAAKSGAAALLSAPRKRGGRRGQVKPRMKIDELGVAYAGKPAVKGVSLTVNQGEVLALIGPSGSSIRPRRPPAAGPSPSTTRTST